MSARVTTALAACLAALCAAGAAMAQLAGAEGGDLLIDADALDIHNARGLAVYQGRVDAVRGDTQIRSDRLELYFERADGAAASGPGAAMGALDHAIAIGNVYYVTSSQIAHGQHAYYDVTADTVTLTGAVTVTQGCDVLTGEEVVINLTTNDAQVRSTPDSAGQGGRVRTVIHQGSETAATTECAQ